MMLLQSNSYMVPKEKRSEHARLMRKFRQTLARLGCDQFDVFEQVPTNWGSGETTGRFVQMMRFRDRRHQQAVQGAEQSDPAARQLIAEFCALVNLEYQQQQSLFGVGFYQSVLPVAPARVGHEHAQIEGESGDIPMAASGETEAAGLHLVEGETSEMQAEISPPPGDVDIASEIESIEVEGEPEPEPPDDFDADITTDQPQQR